MSAELMAVTVTRPELEAVRALVRLPKPAFTSDGAPIDNKIVQFLGDLLQRIVDEAVPIGAGAR